jgi:DNA-binding PadR family transcriptional regulator
MMLKRREPEDPGPGRADPLQRHLPLRPAAFAALAALADGPAAGFEILERATEVAAGRPFLGPGTLYRLLRELRGEGLIERTAAPDEACGGEDERRTYHELTPVGRAVLRAEAERLRRTLDAAGLLPGRDPA